MEYTATFSEIETQISKLNMDATCSEMRHILKCLKSKGEDMRKITIAMKPYQELEKLIRTLRWRMCYKCQESETSQRLTTMLNVMLLKDSMNKDNTELFNKMERLIRLTQNRNCKECR